MDTCICPGCTTVTGAGAVEGDESAAWEMAYKNRPQLWAGTPGSLPDPVPGGRVLELGSGNAVTLSELVRRGWDAVALDFSKTAAKSAHVILRDTPAGSAVRADARYIPFVRDSFTAVIARHVIGHMSAADQNRTVHGIMSVLKPGGVMYFTEFSRDDFRYGKGKETEAGTFLRGTGIATHYFTEPEVSGLFSAFAAGQVTTHRWGIRVRGTLYHRAEIHAVFCKGPGGD